MKMKEFKNELLEVYKEEKYYLDDINDLRRFARENADLYYYKVDREELFRELKKSYPLEEEFLSNYKSGTVKTFKDLIDSYIYLHLEDYIHNFLIEIH